MIHEFDTVDLLTQAFILIDKATQRGILVADLPSIVDDQAQEGQYHHDNGSGEGNGNDEYSIHTLRSLTLCVIRTCSF